MSDRTDTKVRQWALRSNGDTLTVRDAVELVLAVDEDSIVRHEETVSVLTGHCKEAVLRDDRISELERWRESTSYCPERVKKLIIEEHKKAHSEYIASLGDSVFQTRLALFFAGALGKIVLVVIGLMAGILLNIAVYGRP